MCRCEALISSSVPSSGAWWTPEPAIVSSTLISQCMAELTVREARFKQVIVSPRNLSNSLRKVFSFFRTQIHKSSLVLFCNDHNLKWPYSPPRTNNQERPVLEHDSLLFLHLNLYVIGQETRTSIILSVFLQLSELLLRFFWQTSCSPDLAMWMWVRATHSSTFILKNLHPTQLLGRWGDGDWS